MVETAIVTGAASGIGRAMTLGLLRNGISVAGVDREPDWLEELGAAARDLPGRFTALPADLAEATICERIVDEAERSLGQIGALVNNAGIGQGAIRPDQRRNPIRFWEITPEQWRDFLAVNATAPSCRG
jgi:NAD(P)-dependent dehydrogenase (short-subunit alcohol dehydrogenase family)